MPKKQAQIFHFDLYGKREEKYDFLNENSLASIPWTELRPEEPNFFFVNKDFGGKEEYEKGFKVDELFPINTSGIKTHDDGNLVSFDAFSECNEKYDYRPFDIRNICFDLKKVVRPRISVMKHFLEKENLGLITCRQQSAFDFQHVFITKHISDMCSVSSQTKETGYAFPLYLYSENFDTEERTPNLNMEIVEQIATSLQAKFVSDNEEYEMQNGMVAEPMVAYGFPKTFSPIDILDYIYAVLHSPTYREQYKEFLKIDFPRVPFPGQGRVRQGGMPPCQAKFWELVALGKQIREIHLLESPTVEKYITQYPETGNNVVTKPLYKKGNVYINDTQYFANVPQTAWEFYIGGYQPAQKWLKDRKGRTLEFDDILHYQKIIVALTETDRLMKEVDKIGIAQKT
ncbi:MAG: hypothetical protein QM642_04500 [Edaphocola sp.]